MKKEFTSVLICGFPHENPDLPDNLYGQCEECSADIVFRPHSPHGPEVAKLCPKCGFGLLSTEIEEGVTPEPIITTKTAEEIEQLMGIKLKPTEGY